MKRAKTERWEETHRQEVGVSVGEYRRTVGATFTLIYRVTERLAEKGGAVEWRERIVYGRTLYQYVQSGLGVAALLGSVATGVRALSAIAREDDERATSRRRRR